MKKNSKYIVLTAAIALCAGSSLPFLAGSSTLNPERDSVKSEVPYCVTSPSVPDKITFAGQAIDLLRYDHHERMDRELMSFTYMPSTTMLMVKRANRYFPAIEPILKANGLPDDFKGRISTQLQKQMVDQAVDLWLVEETSRYMFRLLAAKAVISNPQQYGFLLKREHLYPPIPYTEVTVTTGIGNLAQFAKGKGITYAQLKDANPWLRDTSLMNKKRTYIHTKKYRQPFPLPVKRYCRKCPGDSTQRLSGGVLQPGPASAGRVHQLSSDHGHQIQERL